MRPGSVTYAPTVAARICAEIAAGRTLVQICEEEWAPSLASVQQWKTRNPEFAKAYQNARAKRRPKQA
jgi:hypothetical protein